MSQLTLVIGNRNYSSWSMRAWVALHAAGITFAEVQIPLRRPESLAAKLEYSPAGRVPVLLDGEVRVWDSLAICEYAAERHPDRGLWPTDGVARAHARAISAEMHAGFESLRTHMPLDTRARYPGRGVGPGVVGDITRVLEIWRACRAAHSDGGTFLFGAFTIADAMYAPVVSRLQTYEVDLDGPTASYAEAVLAHPSVAQWMAAAAQEPWTIAPEDLGIR